MIQATAPASDTSHLTPGELALLGRFVERVLAELGPGAVERITVFGSRARGASHPDSDLDVAVFASPRMAAEGHVRIADIAAELQIGDEELSHLRPIVVHPDRGTRPGLLRNILREGIVLWATKND